MIGRWGDQMGELVAGAKGSASERFERINSVMRRANDAVLAELTKKKEGKRVWFLCQRLRSAMS